MPITITIMSMRSVVFVFCTRWLAGVRWHRGCEENFVNHWMASKKRFWNKKQGYFHMPLGTAFILDAFDNKKIIHIFALLKPWITTKLHMKNDILPGERLKSQFLRIKALVKLFYWRVNVLVARRYRDASRIHSQPKIGYDQNLSTSRYEKNRNKINLIRGGGSFTKWPKNRLLFRLLFFNKTVRQCFSNLKGLFVVHL